METITNLIKDTPIPKMVKVRQNFDKTCIPESDIPGIITRELDRPEIGGKILPGPGAEGQDHVHVLLFPDAPQDVLAHLFPLPAVPLGGIEAVRQKDKAVAARMSGQPFPHAADLFAVFGQGHMAVPDQTAFLQPQGQSLEDALVVGKGAALHIDHPPCLVPGGPVLVSSGKGAVPEQQGQEKQADKQGRDGASYRVHETSERNVVP